MKFVKTFCKPASTIEVIPAGLIIKLQYNQNGLLQKFDIEYGTNGTDYSIDEATYRELFQKIKGFVPNSISVTGGTTWVTGVMYTESIPCDEGNIPVALCQSYIDGILDGGHYKFYGGFVESLAANFQGPLVMRNFLTSNKFNCLPQMIVPVQMTDESLQMMMSTNSFPFKYPFISGFFIFEDLNCRYASSNLFQINIMNDPEPFVDIDGYLKGEIVTKSGDTYTFNYSAIIHHGVARGTTLLVENDRDGTALNILSTRLGVNADKIPETISHDVKCPVCDKVYKVGSDDAPVQCDDPHCMSHEFYTAQKMLNNLKLPEITYDQYKELIYAKDITWITDILDTGVYKDMEIKTTLAEAMYSVIPTHVVPNLEIVERFANKCNHSIESVMYYLNNPLRIETDLDITDPIVRRFVNWLSDPYNVSIISSILSRVTIDAKMQKFDGAPIFRGNKIAVTGRFKRGDYAEIESILLSYAATVVPSIEICQDLPDILLIGSLNEGISGQMVQKARLHNIPIAYEDDFFTKYEIDQDMAANLL